MLKSKLGEEHKSCSANTLLLWRRVNKTAFKIALDNLISPSDLNNKKEMTWPDLTQAKSNNESKQ